MILKPTCHITEVIRFIFESDASVFYNPLKFQGIIRDYYIGNKLVADDFIDVLSSLSKKIENSSIKTKDITNIAFAGINGREKKNIFSELLMAIYVNNDFKWSRDIESYIAATYGESSEYDKPKESNTSNSLILSFGGDGIHNIEYGQVVTLVWECENPYRLCLSNGHESMDVTYLDSIVLSMVSDCYELILYDEEGKVLDKKTIKLQYKRKVYCINCGNLFSDPFVDNFCTRCGVRIYNDN